MRGSHAYAHPKQQTQLPLRLVVEQGRRKTVVLILAVHSAASTAHSETDAHKQCVDAYDRADRKHDKACDIRYLRIEVRSVETRAEQRLYMRKQQREHHKCRNHECSAHHPRYAHAHLTVLHATNTHKCGNEISKHKEHKRHNRLVYKIADAEH